MPVQSTILKMLHDKVENLPTSIPTAKKTGPLAGYCCDPAQLTKDITADDEVWEVWEVWDQKLNVLISHNIFDIRPLVTHGKIGLIVLVRFLEHLVRDRKVNEGLLDRKIGRVMEAIDRHLRFLVFTVTPLLIAVFSVSVSSKTHPRIPCLSEYCMICQWYPSLP